MIEDMEAAVKRLQDARVALLRAGRTLDVVALWPGLFDGLDKRQRNAIRQACAANWQEGWKPNRAVVADLAENARSRLTVGRMMYDYIMLRTQISLTEEDRIILDAEAARTGRSISALIRDAVTRTYGFRRDVDEDVRAIDSALGAWRGRDIDGETYVEDLRSGGRLRETSAR